MAGWTLPEGIWRRFCKTNHSSGTRARFDSKKSMPRYAQPLHKKIFFIEYPFFRALCTGMLLGDCQMLREDNLSWINSLTVFFTKILNMFEIFYFFSNKFKLLLAFRIYRQLYFIILWLWTKKRHLVFTNDFAFWLKFYFAPN